MRQRRNQPPQPPLPQTTTQNKRHRKRGAKSCSAILRQHLPHTMIVRGARSKTTESKLHRCLLGKHGLREGFDTFRLCMNMTACTAWCCFSEHKLQTAAKPPHFVNPLAEFRARVGVQCDFQQTFGGCVCVPWDPSETPNRPYLLK